MRSSVCSGASLDGLSLRHRGGHVLLYDLRLPLHTPRSGCFCSVLKTRRPAVWIYFIIKRTPSYKHLWTALATPKHFLHQLCPTAGEPSHLAIGTHPPINLLGKNSFMKELSLFFLWVSLSKIYTSNVYCYQKALLKTPRISEFFSRFCLKVPESLLALSEKH